MLIHGQFVKKKKFSLEWETWYTHSLLCQLKTTYPEKVLNFGETYRIQDIYSPPLTSSHSIQLPYIGQLSYNQQSFLISFAALAKGPL